MTFGNVEQNFDEEGIREDERNKVLEELEQWHYDEINRFKLKRPSVISYLPSIKAHERSIKRILELRQKEQKREKRREMGR
jgi:hypothetical protein